MHRRACAFLLVTMLFCDQALLSQTTTTPKTASTKSAASSDEARIKDLGDTIDVLTKIKSDPQFTPSSAIKNTLDAQIHQMTCERNKLLLRQSLSGTAELRNSVADAYFAACTQTPSQSTSPGSASNTNQDFSGLANVAPPPGCTPVRQIHFATDQPASNTPPPTDTNATDRSNQVRLNANSTGGEIATKSTVYVEWINRVRYSATLGGVVTTIQAPSFPDGIFPTSSPAKANTATTSASARPAARAAEDPVAKAFLQFQTCLNDVWNNVSRFQSDLLTQEEILNNTREAIGNRLQVLQPVVGTLDEARRAAETSIFPPNVVPPFPIGDVAALKALLDQVIPEFQQFQDWAKANSLEDVYNDLVTNANADLTTLKGYLGGTSPPAADTAQPSASNRSKVAPDNTSRTARSAGTKAAQNNNTPPSANSDAQPSQVGNSGDNKATSVPNSIVVGSKEVTDYGANRSFVNAWRDQFKTVASARPDYFIVDYQPVCGTWFGQGTSTQMQLTIVDFLNPTAKTTPTNLDKVVCQPILTITNGLGLSFISDKTPAFVPLPGKPDSSGNPTIVQSLGYSSQAKVRPAYALQINAALWGTEQAGFEIHASTGAMLTATTGGATTDILAGLSMSFKKRAIFVSPMYDLGLRTVYVPPFHPGMPQGNLTSPPTHQVWKSGFGMTVTFPFSTGTKSTDSTSSNKPGTSGTADNPSTGNNKTGTGTKGAGTNGNAGGGGGNNPPKS